MRAQARGHTRSEEHDRLFIIFFYEIVDQTVIVQDLQGGIHHTVAGAGSDLQYLCISPNGQLLATVHGDRYSSRVIFSDIDKVYTIKFWDLVTGLPRGALKDELKIMGYPKIDFSPDGRLVALISNRRVKVCSQMESWELDRVGTKNPEQTRVYAQSPDGQISAHISTGGVELWDPQTGLPDDRFPRDARIYAFSPDGRFVALISTGRVRLWKESIAIANYEARISPDGQWLVDLPDLGGDGKHTIQVIQLWDTSTGELSSRLKLSTETRIESMVFSPDSIFLQQSARSRSFSGT